MPPCGCRLRAPCPILRNQPVAHQTTPSVAHQTTPCRWLLPSDSDLDPVALAQALAGWDEEPDRVRHTGPLPPPLDSIGVKIFRARTGKWRRLLGLSPALREWAVATALHEQGLPVPEPLALGLGAGPRGEDAYLFRWHGQLTDLARAHQEGRLSAQSTRRLAPRLGELVRQLHEEGVAHRDLHAGNLLWDGDLGIWLCDFHRARRWSWARTRDACDLSHLFLTWARPADLLRFLRAWRPDDWPRDRRARRDYLRAWQTRVQASLRRFLRHHERRCLGAGRAYLRVRHGASAGVALRPSPDLSLLSLVTDPRRLRARTREVHRGRASVVRRGHAPARSVDLAFKVFEDPGWSGFCKRLWRGSRARRAWRLGMRLRMAELPTPLPHLFLEDGLFTARRRSVLVEGFLADFHSLREWWSDASEPQRRLLVTNMAGQLARLHDSFLRHRDLKAENLLVDPCRTECVFLDPDGVRRVRRVDLRHAARDLMRLNASFRPAGPVSLCHRARFLRAYLRARRTERLGRRSLWRRIVRETEIKWASQASRPH